MPMNKACEFCGGACCKSIILNLNRILDVDSLHWFQLHGEQGKNGTRLNVACTKLVDGKCSIYERRPGVCRKFLVGSVACLEAIKKHCPEKLEAVEKLIHERD